MSTTPSAPQTGPAMRELVDKLEHAEAMVQSELDLPAGSRDFTGGTWTAFRRTPP